MDERKGPTNDGDFQLYCCGGDGGVGGGLTIVAKDEEGRWNMF